MSNQRFNRNFTLSEKAWNWLNKLKYESQTNLSAYVNALIMRDLDKKAGKENGKN